ncbi:MAG: hypothetical protein M1819_001267 [Sarea resinae]|nr:MAG: hypothetical protein M1819_001267 [Sarea resinae]
MFRSPNEVSSSDPESSSDDDANLDPLEGQTADGWTQESEHSLPENVYLDSNESIMIPDLEPSGHADFIYSSLLEFYCYTTAAELLNRQEGANGRYTREDPEVQALGRSMFTRTSQQLGNVGVMNQGYDEDNLEEIRQGYIQGLEFMSLNALRDAPAPGEASPAALQALRQQAPQATAPPLAARPRPRRMLTNVAANPDPVLDGENGPHDDLAGNASEKGISHSGTELGLNPSMDPAFPPSRYSSDFTEVGMIGKGGYGKVYRVMNHLDGQEYAIKKISLSQKQLKRLQDGGASELEALLREIRTLARLEHTNVVRYFSGWIERSGEVVSTESTRKREPLRRLLSDHSTGADGEFSFGIAFEDDYEKDENPPEDDGIVFGYSSPSRRDQSDSDEGQGRQRRDSHTTASTNHSRKSFVQNADDDEDEIESIPRKFETSNNFPTSTLDETSSDDFSDGKLCVPQTGNDSRHAATGPTLTLHIQMSLHPLSLSIYLSPDSPKEDANDMNLSPRHCYHVLPSVQLLLSILSGVEYLHSQGVVHRDLKPGNIFLSVAKGNNPHPASGCVEVASCPNCCPTTSTPSTPTYITPRIGDFGLVGELTRPKDPSPDVQSTTPGKILGTVIGSSLGSNNSLHSPALQPASPLKAAARLRAVGTEFYRPPSLPHSSSTSSASHHHNHNDETAATTIDEKLDVFSLGVIAFETVWPFSTRMERHETLSRLVKGHFPPNFSAKVGESTGRLESCIRGMLALDPRARMACCQVRRCLEELLSSMAVS